MSCIYREIRVKRRWQIIAKCRALPGITSIISRYGKRNFFFANKEFIHVRLAIRKKQKLQFITRSLLLIANYVLRKHTGVDYCLIEASPTIPWSVWYKKSRYFPFFLSRNGSRIIHSVDASVSRMRFCLRKVAIASMRGRAWPDEGSTFFDGLSRVSPVLRTQRT